MVLVVAFLGLIASLAAGVALRWWDIATAKDLAAFALTPLAGLKGTVVGFYYAGGRASWRAARPVAGSRKNSIRTKPGKSAGSPTGG